MKSKSTKKILSVTNLPRELGADGALTNNKDRLSKCSLIESRVRNYVITVYLITIILCFMSV